MRGQVSFEFLIVMSLAVLMLGTFLVVGSFELTRHADETRAEHVIDIARTVQHELATASIVHDGYERSFFLPKQVENQPYTISQQNSTTEQIITVVFKNKAYSVRAPLCVGAVQPGSNTVRKTGGVLYCNA